MDFPLAKAHEIAPQSGGTGLLYLQDMFSSEFACGWPLSGALALQQRFQRLLVAQSITARKGELLQVL